MTKTDWTAEEVREYADRIDGDGGEVSLRKCQEIIYAFANRIEADESAVPAVWANKVELQDQITRKAKPGCVYCIDAADHQTGLFTEPLFTRPPAQPAQEQPGWKMPESWRIETGPRRSLLVCGNGKRIEVDFGDALYPFFAMLAASPTPPKEK
jgi:hypothetical protein